MSLAPSRDVMMKRLLLASVLLASPTLASAAPIYLPSGPQTNVAAGAVTGGGWTQCYAATMDVYIGNAGENVLNACAGDYLMMAGRVTGSDTFLVLAAALRADTIVDTGNTSVTHLANGSNWWYSDNWSWGFTADGDGVDNYECDTSDSPTSMCLHTVNGAGGYRINNILGLNGSVDYEKVFFVANDDARNDVAAVPEPGTIALVSMGLAGLARRRRQRVS
jgi:hypothetical protein